MVRKLTVSTLRVIVTGGSSGIGYEVARRFLAMGAVVGLVARDRDRLEGAQKRLLQDRPQGVVRIACLDIARQDDDWSVIEHLVTEMGGLDVLINNAGSIMLGTFLTMTPKDHMAAMNANYHGHLAMTHKLIPALGESSRARICFVSSVAGFLGIYGPAKFALTGLAECLRQELGPLGIQVSIAFPPDTETPMFAYEQQHRPPETRALAGTVRPKSAAHVADRLVTGLMAGQFEIFFERQSRIIRLIKCTLPGLYALVSDWIIRQSRRET
jgi:3-dehydrosphinganine reductase